MIHLYIVEQTIIMKAFLLSMIFIFFGLLNAHAQSEIYTSLEVDDFPIIEKCQNENSNCFRESLKIYIQKNIDITNLTKYTSAKAYAQFVVMESGEIKDIKVRTTNKDLKKEAIKLLNDLKIKSPAMKNGAPVSMTYVIPISFNKRIINEDGKPTVFSSLTKETKGPELAFKDAFILPFIKECKSSGKDTCFEDLIAKRIVNFLKSSKKMKLELKDRMELKIYFEIQANGQVSNALVVCESNKIMKELPDFINNMKITEAAKNKENKYIPTYFMKNVVL